MASWVRRDGTRMAYSDMGRHHAWNAARMLRRNGRTVPRDVSDIAGDVRGLRLAWYHARNILWLLAHPWKIDRCMIRGI